MEILVYNLQAWKYLQIVIKYNESDSRQKLKIQLKSIAIQSYY